MIEEEREEDEKKLNIAIAAAERMNVLVRQTALKKRIIKYSKGSSHLSLCNWPTEIELKSLSFHGCITVYLQEEQFAGMLKDLRQLSDACNSGQNNMLHPEKAHIISSETV